jgi:glutaconate CoA-transferase subunit A
LIGSDILAHRADYTVVDNPLAGGGDPIVLVPAIRPDLALIHAPLADRDGNLWIGRDHELRMLAHAAKRTVATAEAVFDGDLMADPVRAAGVIPAFYVDGIAVVPGGARPCALAGLYGEDGTALAAYGEAAATPDGLRAWLDRFLTESGPPRRAAA